MSWKKAWSVLRRDGFSKDDLAALSDEAIARLAAHRKKVQSDVDRMLNESKKTDSAPQAQSPEEPSEPKTAEAAQGQPVGTTCVKRQRHLPSMSVWMRKAPTCWRSPTKP